VSTKPTPAASRDGSTTGSTHVPLPVTAAHRAEYAALRGVVAGLRLVGFGAASGIGASLGRLGYRPLGIRRSVVERQIRAVMPELSEADVQRIARGAYEHLGRTSIEAALLPSRSNAQVRGLVEDLRGWDLVEQNVHAGGGQIVLTGHLGNWELAGAYVAARGVPIDVVARHMANPLFERYVSTTRERSGMHELHDDVAARRIPRALRAGHFIAMLADQGAVGLSSTWVPFFGRLAKTARGPAVFALRMGVPVLFAACIRRPSGRYTLSFEPVPVIDTGDREGDVDRILEAYSGILERWVRAAPEQYLWHHRRWKHQQPGTPAALGDPLATTT
jgi:KDO2-lipid IV(A) lauroyltransferase